MNSFIFLTLACEIFRRKISLATAGYNKSLVFVEKATEGCDAQQKAAKKIFSKSSYEVLKKTR